MAERGGRVWKDESLRETRREIAMVSDMDLLYVL